MSTSQLGRAQLGGMQLGSYGGEEEVIAVAGKPGTAPTIVLRRDAAMSTAEVQNKVIQ